MITRGLALPTVRPTIDAVTRVIAIWYRAFYIIYVNGNSFLQLLFNSG